MTVGENRLTKRGFYASEEFLEMFEFPLITGNAEQVMDDPRSVIVNEATAKALFAPAYPFEYRFVDVEFQKKFSTINLTSQLASLFVTIIITGLGLFGLAAFTSEQRTKEIGIRKVLGATVPSLSATDLQRFLIPGGSFFCYLVAHSLVVVIQILGALYHSNDDSLVGVSAHWFSGIGLRAYYCKHTGVARRMRTRRRR